VEITIEKAHCNAKVSKCRKTKRRDSGVQAAHYNCIGRMRYNAGNINATSNGGMEKAHAS